RRTIGGARARRGPVAVDVAVVTFDAHLGGRAERARVRRAARRAAERQLGDRGVVLLLRALPAHRVGLAQLLVERLPLHARVRGLDVALGDRLDVLRQRLLDPVLAPPDGCRRRDAAGIVPAEGITGGGDGRRPKGQDRGREEQAKHRSHDSFPPGLTRYALLERLVNEKNEPQGKAAADVPPDTCRSGARSTRSVAPRERVSAVG